jgi:hypothetical protein
MFQKDDRIELVRMTDDPHPVPAGTKGTIEFINKVTMGHEEFVQVGVKWDNGSSLMVVIPPDVIRHV